MCEGTASLRTLTAFHFPTRVPQGIIASHYFMNKKNLNLETSPNFLLQSYCLKLFLYCLSNQMRIHRKKKTTIPQIERFHLHTSSDDSAKECEKPGVLGSAPKPLKSAELVLLGLKSSLNVKFCGEKEE